MFVHQHLHITATTHPRQRLILLKKCEYLDKGSRGKLTFVGSCKINYKRKDMSVPPYTPDITTTHLKVPVNILFGTDFGLGECLKQQACTYMQIIRLALEVIC